MDMWCMFSKSCVLTQGSQADKNSSKLLTRGLFGAYHDCHLKGWPAACNQILLCKEICGKAYAEYLPT